MSKSSKISKAIMFVALGATALTSLAGTASAENTNDVTLRFNHIAVEQDGSNGMDGSGMTLESTGRYDSGFQYDATIMHVGFGDGAARVDDNFMEVNARYMMGNIGPEATYQYNESTGDNVFALGLAAELGDEDARGYASIVSDVEDYFDTYRLRVGGEFAVAENASLRAEYVRTSTASGMAGSTSDEQIEIGGRYGIMDNLYLDANVIRPLETGTTDMAIYGVGLGLQF
jgi:hypothetical protein